MTKFMIPLFALFFGSSLAVPADAPSAEGAKAKPYPLKTCIVSDEALDGDAVSRIYDGQEIKVCCKMCFKDFEKDKATYLKKLQSEPKAK
jgi:hypothetical protein